MTTTTLPFSITSPRSGWTFQGAWSAADQATIEQTLRTGIPNPSQAHADPWLFLCHVAAYYAHNPSIHSSDSALVASTASDLAELLWDHYFSLHLGPLAWAFPSAPTHLATPPGMPADDSEDPTDSLLVSLDQEQQALEHFQTARGLLADGEYAAAKLELELSLTLEPARSFFDHKRVETLGDIESSLGDDTAALGHYRRALELALEWKESWTHTELRLKLVWALLRQEQIAEAYDIVKTALAVCQDGATDPAGERRGLNELTALALATLADVHFHQHNIDAAIVTARQAAAVAGRLGQAYAQKVRLLTYLAWQLYRHDETTEARTLAYRAQQALGRWMPLDARYIRSIRTTLSTILGTPPPRMAPSPRTSLPTPEARIEQALSAARAMQDWLRQLLALHALTPYLAPGQLTPPLTDIRVWSEDFSHEESYQILLAADLAHALADPENTSSAAARSLLAIEPRAFHYLGHEWLHAETLLRMRDYLEDTEQALVTHAIVRCALAWCDEVRQRPTDGATIARPRHPSSDRTCLTARCAAPLIVLLIVRQVHSPAHRTSASSQVVSAHADRQGARGVSFARPAISGQAAGNK